MKKIIALLLALTLALSLCVPAHAASGLVYDLSATNTTAGTSSTYDAEWRKLAFERKKGR